MLVGYDLLSALAANIGDSHDILPNKKSGLLFFFLFIYEIVMKTGDCSVENGITSSSYILIGIYGMFSF